MLRRRGGPLLLAAAAGAAALAASSAVSSPSLDGHGATSVLHAVARSSRAVYTIGFVVVDYKYSLRGLAPGSTDYRDKRSESLPPDFLTILRTDGLLRSILGNLGVPHRVRHLTYAKCAIYGLEEQNKLQSGSIKRTFLQVKVNISYLRLRLLIELAGFLMQVNDLRLKVMSRFKRMLQKSS